MLIKNILQFLISSILILFLAGSIHGQTGDVRFVHDPCIIKADNYYYIFSTGDRIEMRRSGNFNHWQRLNQVFQSIPEWGVNEVSGVTNIWAPDIFYRDSTYYLYYSLSTFGSNHSRIGLATNKTLDPNSRDYEWIDQGKVIGSSSSNNYNAIDPNIVEDIEGKLWLSFGSFWSGIKLVQMDTTTMKPYPNAVIYSIASRHNYGAIEAPFIIYKNGYYYLFVSFDKCCEGINSTYNIRVGRSEEITGPYKDKNDVLMTSGGGSLVIASNDRWKGQGHCAVLLEEENDWLVHHAYDAQANGIPTLRIEKLFWDKDNWPTIDDPATAIEEAREIPTSFELHQNYPNPFNPSTIIKYSIPEVVGKGYTHSLKTVLTIYDVLGNKIKTIVDEQKSAGTYSVKFNAFDIPSGVYLYRLQCGNLTQTKKLVLIK